jgi:ubiquinone/menaquinone biosynthesis C-methylase UbiE
LPEHGEKAEKYIPAFGYKWLTYYYDSFMRWVMRESAFKRQLVEQAHIGGGHRVLDLGCGTGTLTILVKQSHPQAEVIGLDGDPEIIKIARKKISSAGLDIHLDRGMAFGLPYSDSSFDRVVSTLFFHHLTRENKRRTLIEVHRVLRPGGELFLIDFGQPHGALMYLISLFMRQLEENHDNICGLLPGYITEAGFAPVEELDRYRTVLGNLSLFRARKY